MPIDSWSPRTLGDRSVSSLELDELLRAMSVDPSVGLAAAEVDRRRARVGRNQLRSVSRERAGKILFDQFKSIVILLLLAAGGLAILFSEFVEGLAIIVVVAINTGIGFVTELRAVRSMEALSRLGGVETTVMREGLVRQVPAEELVPGDIVIHDAGDIVTADLRLIEASKLKADESTLTGESMPVRKSVGVVAAGTPAIEQSNMLFKGTAITRGSCTSVVTATGVATELGKIAELVVEAEAQETPLEKRLDALARRLVWAVLALAVLIAITGIAAGRETFLAIEVAIALAVAAIPEGLPIVATVALARGMWRMARQNALIARLSAVETLGATSVILSDKTGTLTENRMTVTTILLCDMDLEMSATGFEALGPVDADDRRPITEASALADDLLAVSALCNNASIDRTPEGDIRSVGDPTEVALLVAAEKRKLERPSLLERMPELRELAFDPDTKRMATLHRESDAVLVAAKGAPEAIVPLCTQVHTGAEDTELLPAARDTWLERAQALGEQGLRTLAVARKIQRGVDDDAYSGLTLLGIVGLEDPPRKGIRNVIRQCHDAGISVVMVTGDHAATARNVATEVGIVSVDSGPEQFVSQIGQGDAAGTDITDIDEQLDVARVYSRVSAEQKLDLIDAYQRHAHVVAMTGDGVNDAPALKKADIGIAMGVRGTAVAKEAAEMILQDDDFGTIVDAVAQGRAIYSNIRKFVVYLLSCNISEVLIVSIATVAGAPLPLLPLQILFLNLVTDVFPALALGVGEGSRTLMNERPRPFDEPILTQRHWLRILLHSVVIALAVLAAMALGKSWLRLDADAAVTISFCTLTLAQVWHVLNMRSDNAAFFDNEITRNAWIWAAIAICVALLLAAVYLPVLSEVLSLSGPGTSGWLLIVGMSLVPVVVGPVVRRLTPKLAHRSSA